MIGSGNGAGKAFHSISGTIIKWAAPCKEKKKKKKKQKTNKQTKTKKKKKNVSWDMRAARAKSADQWGAHARIRLPAGVG